MRRYVTLTAVIASCSCGLNAQDLASDVPPQAAQSASPALSTTTNEAECHSFLDSAQAHQYIGSIATTEKRFAASLDAYTKADQEARQALSLCPGEDQAKAQALIQSLSGQVARASESRQRAEVCRPTFDKALALDLQAATAKKNKAAIAEVERLYNQAVSTWQEAVANCRGKDQARANKSLSETTQALTAIRSLSDSGKGCDNAWRSAEAMVELAKTAWAEKRWNDSALLYRQAAMGWEIAEEECETGDRHVQALKKQESAELDAHNAANCAPRWDEARELSQRLKVESQVLNAQDRSELSMRAEALWRKEVENCLGPAKDKAKSNADVIAKDRGTPLTVLAIQQAGSPAKQETTVPSPARKSGAGDAKPAPSLHTAPAQSLPSANASVTAPIVATENPARAKDTPMEMAKEESKRIAPEGMAYLTVVAPNIFRVGGMTYEGAFQVDDSTRSMSGTGTIKWENGDTFTGTVVKGEKQGKGKFIWHDGRIYDGEWVNNRMDGMASVSYPNGDRYTGRVRAGVPDGQGKFAFASGDIYSGEFRDGHIDGFGRFTWKNGDYYEGEWKNDKKDGRGEYVWASGMRSTGVYKDGVIVADAK